MFQDHNVVAPSGLMCCEIRPHVDLPQLGVNRIVDKFEMSSDRFSKWRPARNDQNRTETAQYSMLTGLLTESCHNMELSMIQRLKMIALAGMSLPCVTSLSSPSRPHLLNFRNSAGRWLRGIVGTMLDGSWQATRRLTSMSLDDRPLLILKLL